MTRQITHLWPGARETYLTRRIAEVRAEIEAIDAQDARQAERQAERRRPDATWGRAQT